MSGLGNPSSVPSYDGERMTMGCIDWSADQQTASCEGVMGVKYVLTALWEEAEDPGCSLCLLSCSFPAPPPLSSCLSASPPSSFLPLLTTARCCLDQCWLSWLPKLEVGGVTHVTGPPVCADWPDALNKGGREGW